MSRRPKFNFEHAMPSGIIQISDANFQSEIATITPWIEEQSLNERCHMIDYQARLCEKQH